ncbi:Putative replication termination factor 2, Zinc finger, RING/FYVE/PHD-type [Septoria linicola]|uniref:Replication termination factor 2, Zinc finger, RING/FYVE/PHD-type n=1 Tax=Septoria linicola TaxID=215465 RepID=A0A9Q9B189_9PEZI|nr:Putative replication termination factor 2, Zinc finger, RING/FYVE/PHD-type [Septoria linicola]
MGNDGGSIPTRRELVKEAAKDKTTAQVKEAQQEQQEYYWTTDPISREPLTQPVVSDSSGKLYNKSTILEYLVEGARKEDADAITQGAVKSLKDVVEVKFEVDAEAKREDGKKEVWRCSVTGDKLGPGSKAAYLVPCGHAFSGSAIKEVSGEKCLACETECASNDIIPILPTAAMDIARLALRVKTLQEKGLAHSLKKASGGKKRKKGKEENGGEEGEKLKSNGEKRKKEDDVNGSSSINNSSAASIAAKVVKEQEQAKKRKLENENVKSLFSTRDQSKPMGKSADFMTRGFSVPSESKR